MPLHEETTIRIGHLAGTSPAYGFIWIGEERRYQLTSLVVRRPPTGRKLIELECATCGAELLLRVRSMALSRSIRKRYMLTALTGLAVAVLVLGGGVLSEEAGVFIPLSTALGKVLLIALLVGLLVFGIFSYAWTHEEGLRLYSGTGRADETHRVLFGAEPHDASAP